MKTLLYWIKHVNIFKSLYYSLKFGGRIIVGKANVTIRQGGNISFANKNSVLYVGVNYSYPMKACLDIYNSGELFIDGKVSINRGCKIRIYNQGILRIGNNSYINECAKIYCAKDITIGNNCAIAFDTLIMDSDIHAIYKNNKVINLNSPIYIGNDVWVGAKSVILKGSKIESNTIIAANSLAIGELKSQHIYGGVPVKIISDFDKWRV